MGAGLGGGQAGYGAGQLPSGLAPGTDSAFQATDLSRIGPVAAARQQLGNPKPPVFDATTVRVNLRRRAASGSPSPMAAMSSSSFRFSPTACCPTTIQPAEHLAQRGHARCPLPREPQSAGYLLTLVSTPLADGVQTARPAPHGAHRQPWYRPQWVSPPLRAARIRYPAQRLDQRQTLPWSFRRTHGSPPVL